MSIPRYSARDIARYFLAQVDEEAGDNISNLKLQKLLYYAQGFYLAIFDEPLFPDTIEAWAHGPVIPYLYHEYKTYGAGPIPVVTDLDYEDYNSKTREFLDEVYKLYGQYSAWKLRNMTHEDPPWKNAIKEDGIISHESMKEYFKTQLEE